MTSQMPEPDSFKLPEIAERWNCEVDLLMDYFRDGKLEIMVMLDGNDGYIEHVNPDTGIRKLKTEKLIGLFRIKKEEVIYTWYKADYFINERPRVVKEVFNENGNRIKLVNCAIPNSKSLRISKLERDRFEDEHDIIFTAIDTEPSSTQEIQQTLTIQEKRELILKGWLAGTGIDTNVPLEPTREELWEILRKIDSKVFPPVSIHTIEEFFKNQKLCKLRPGRRKGGN